jgi:GTP pyrophosphokinase
MKKDYPKFKSFTNKYRKELFQYLIYNMPKLTEFDRDLIWKAYKIAYDAHINVTRKGGEKDPYITHPVEVAKIIANEMGFGATSIAAALLHDVVEDNEHYTLDYIKKEFNEDIALIVEGVTKITSHGDEKESLDINDETAQKNYYINLLKKIPNDYRVLLIKVADRIHNMRTMDDMPEKSRNIKSAENMIIYAPLAGRTGLWNIKKELEDRSFKYLKNDEYNQTIALKKRYDNIIKVSLVEFQKELNIFVVNDYDFRIITTQKSIYSTWNKITKQRIPYEKIHNLYSTRIVVNLSCKDKNKEKVVKRKVLFSIYLQISEIYEVKNLRDWVIKPKNNGFCALVFDVMYKGNWQEIQLLTEADNVIADRGFFDKEHAPGLTQLQIDIRQDISEVMNQIEDQNSNKTIRIYTPKGRNFDLPENVTVLDFAFQIHTDLGMKCWGAKINNEDRRVSRSYKLRNNDQVEILTVDYLKPSFEWLQCATLSRTKKIISNYLKKENPTEFEDYLNKNKTLEGIDFNPKAKFVINNSILFNTAKCCMPVWGEDALVFRNKNNNSFLIHSSVCPNALDLLAKSAENIAIVEWGIFPDDYFFLAELDFDGRDRLGITKDIIDVFSKYRISIHRILVDQIGEHFKGNTQIYVKNFDQLNMAINEIKQIKDLYKVERSAVKKNNLMSLL